MKKSLIATLLIGATVLPALQGCFTVVAAGVTSGVMATVDRRSIGTQTEDETIEWKANAQVSEKLGDKAHLNFTSYNRKVLITGEVPNEDAKGEAERIVVTKSVVLQLRVDRRKHHSYWARRGRKYRIGHPIGRLQALLTGSIGRRLDHSTGKRRGQS